MNKKFFSVLLVGIWLLIIYWFSSQNGEVSSELSDNFLFQFLIQGKTPDQIEYIHFIIRKIAHVSEYFILSMLMINMFFQFQFKGIQLIFISGVFVFISASFDEIHQKFVPGRVGTIKDVFVDLMGFIVAIIIMLILKGLKQIRALHRNPRI